MFLRAMKENIVTQKFETYITLIFLGKIKILWMVNFKYLKKQSTLLRLFQQEHYDF